MCNVFIDTSSIIFGFENKSSVFGAIASQLPSCIPKVSKGILKELNKISHNKGKKGACAKSSLREIGALGLEIDSNDSSGDDWLLGIASKSKGAKIVTNDSALAKKLKSLGANVFKLSKSGILRNA
ncbi:MAG: hypothetical protein ACP5NE_00250 [Candidatus Micrarchaeia archaeon]